MQLNRISAGITMAMLLGASNALASYTFASVDVPSANPGTTTVNGSFGSTLFGNYRDAAGVHGYLLANGIYTPINFPQTYTFATVSGYNGQTVVGTFTDSAGLRHGFSETGGVFTPLDAPLVDPGPHSDGTVVAGISGNTIFGGYGYAYSDSHGPTVGTRGFRLTGGVYDSVDYPLLPEFASSVSGIDGNLVFGSYTFTDGTGSFNSEQYLLNNGIFSTVSIPLSQAKLTAISGGTMLGTYQSGAHGFVDAGGIYTTLDDPLANPIAVNEGTTPTGIYGTTIVGTYMDRIGSGSHGFIATLDVPEPASLAVMAAAIPMLLIRVMRGRRK